MERLKLIDVIPTGASILKKIDETQPLAFADSKTLSVLDEDYLMLYSGMKRASDILTNNLGENEKVDPVIFDKVITIIGNRYVDKWNALWRALTIDYDVIENYNMIEEERSDGQKDEDETTGQTSSQTKSSESSKTTNISGSSSLTGSNVDTHDLHEAEALGVDITEHHVLDGHEVTAENNSHVEAEDTKVFNYGLDSDAQGAPQERTDRDETDTDTNSRTVDTDDVNDNTVKRQESRSNDNTGTLTTATAETGTTSQEGSESLTGTENASGNISGTLKRKSVDALTRTLTRHGNIGVTTSAQMQEQYLKLMKTWRDFFPIIYTDLDSVLALNIY